MKIKSNARSQLCACLLYMVRFYALLCEAVSDLMRDKKDEQLDFFTDCKFHNFIDQKRINIKMAKLNQKKNCTFSEKKTCALVWFLSYIYLMIILLI